VTKEELYKKLSEPIPAELLEKYSATDGAELTTYPAQYAIDLLNDVLGYGKYTVKTEILEKAVYGKAWVVAMSVTIAFVIDEAWAEFTGYGSEYAKDLDIALKSAKTKAFKHACRFIGIGKELYYDEVVEVKKEEAQVEEEIVVDSPSTDLLNQIKASTSVAELDNILSQINGIESEKIKAMLIKKYNDKKIELSE
jgi:hypothetical protein